MTMIGKTLPDATFVRLGEDGPESLTTDDIAANKRILIFALPGAFTPTCSHDHLPGYVQNADALRKAGIDEIYCVTVNDAFVCKAWSDQAGAEAAGVQILGDAASEFTRAMGLDFDGPPVGLYGRSKRYALVANDKVIEKFETEENLGMCSLSSASHFLGLLDA